MRVILFFIAALTGFSCKKERKGEEVFSESVYKFTVTGLWTSPLFTVPSSAHFTYFGGLVHDETKGLWEPGKTASPGVEAVAETGNTLPLSVEIDSLIENKKGIGTISIPPPSPTGSVSRNFYCNSRFPSVSFLSMIAPSPDWFIGISNLNLYRNNQWLTDTTIQLFVYDAGTEEGDIFDYNNPPTFPLQPIQLLSAVRATVLANGNLSLAAIAQVRIQKQ